MNRKLLTMAVAAALSAPAVASPAVLKHGGGIGDWFRSKGGRRMSKRAARSVSSLQLRGWKEAPCDAPEGYFWKQDTLGKLWRLYAAPPMQGKRTYDPVFDRTIIYSGWGYVKPTYAPGMQL
jgi:hypothetical protein